MTAAGAPPGSPRCSRRLACPACWTPWRRGWPRPAPARSGTPGSSRCCARTRLARRDAAKVTRRIRAARFPAGATLEDFDFGYNPKLPAAQIRDLARLEFIAAGEGIIAYGPVGVGKSHLAAALGHQACRRGHDVTFTTCSRLLADLAGGHADRSFDARVRKLAKTAVLICDDFAMREFTAAQADDLYELLTERIGRPGRSLILTSNRSPVRLVPAVPQRGRRRVHPGPGPQHQPPPAAGRQELPSPAPPRPARARPRRPAPAMTRRRRLRRRSFPVRCAPPAGGRAAQGYGAAPPAPRLLRIACGDGPAGPALTPETTAAPGGRGKRAGPSLPQPSARRVRRTRCPRHQ